MMGVAGGGGCAPWNSLRRKPTDHVEKLRRRSSKHSVPSNHTPHASCVASASDVCSANITLRAVDASPLSQALDNWRACARGATLSSIGVPGKVVGIASSAPCDGDADDERLGILDPESREREGAAGREVQGRPSERRGGRISSSEDDEDEDEESEDSAADEEARVRRLELLFGAERRDDCAGGERSPRITVKRAIIARNRTIRAIFPCFFQI